MLDRLLSLYPRVVTINVILHLVLGVVSTFTRFPLIAWFYLMVIAGFSVLINPQKSFSKYAALLVYLTSFDVTSRMTKTSPFIPYELSKYITLVFAIWGIINLSTNGKRYIFISILLLPAFFIDQIGVTDFNDWINNGIAPINLGLLVALFYRQKVSVNTIFIFFRLILYTSLMVLAYSFYKTPDYDEIDFKLSANFITSGGFGSNQVSTILGLGGFVIAVFLLLGRPLTSFKWLDIGLFFFFVFQGLLTFSRGGMLGMALAIMVFTVFAGSGGSKRIVLKTNKAKLGSYVFVVIIFVSVVFILVDNLTDNALLLRYQGETAGTSGGYREKNLNVITSNRYDIFIGDLELWKTAPLLGVGVGASKYLRSKVEDTVAHVEFSRLLAEHGLAGLFFFLIWLSLFFHIRKNNKEILVIAIFNALFVLAVYTSFHAAMRTYVTPLLTAIAMLSVYVSTPKTQKYNH